MMFMSISNATQINVAAVYMWQFHDVNAHFCTSVGVITLKNCVFIMDLVLSGLNESQMRRFINKL